MMESAAGEVVLRALSDVGGVILGGLRKHLLWLAFRLLM